MPKKLGKGTFEKIRSKENLELALKNAKSCRSGSQSPRKKAEIQAVVEHWDVCLEFLQLILDHDLYNYFPYKHFTKKERGKTRNISSLPFYPYRIVDWAVAQVCGKRFISSMCDHTYAALEGRGTHKALKRTQKYIRSSKSPYTLKIDIKGYFEHIVPKILEDILHRYIKDKQLLSLLHNVIYGYDGPGIPLGNYLSQFFANNYLTPFDHYCKEVLHTKEIIRYMDDIVIFGYNTRWLKRTLNRISEYLKDIGLTIKGNWQIFRTWLRGVDFLGYRSYRTHTLLRTSTKKRFCFKMRKLEKKLKAGGEYTIHDMGCVAAYSGILSYCNGKHLYSQRIQPIRSILRYDNSTRAIKCTTR